MRQRPMHARRLSAARFLWTLALLSLPTFGCGQGPATGVGNHTTDLLGQAVAAVGASQRVSVLVDVAVLKQYEGETSETQTIGQLSIQRPNRWAMWPRSGEEGFFVVSDGKQYVRGNSAARRYVVAEPPPTLSAIIEDCANDFDLAPDGLFFVSPGGYDDLIEQTTDSRDLGVDEVDGHECRHLHFAGSEFSLDVWLETSTPPLISKLAFDFPQIAVDVIDEEGQIRTEGAGSMSLVYQFRDWQLDPKFPADQFAFVPPAGWKEVDQLADAMPDPEEPSSPLMGKLAPDFQLETLDGKLAGVAEHRDHQVVILDFWATWCGPCRKALPTVAKVAAEYRDRGVAFYAIDLKDSRDDVARVLADAGLDIPVLLDHDGSVGELYDAKIIPQTVLIGKDGTMQVVHVGVVPDLAARLGEELEALLAGENLAAEADESNDMNQSDPAEPQTSDEFRL
ncbi:MAG TPA: DUF2092 domain-containing protein [Pirellulales bacterium]